MPHLSIIGISYIYRAIYHFPFSIIEIRSNVFILSFVELSGKQTVLEGRPWIFYNFLFLLKNFDGNTPSHLLVFYHECFWVQLHKLPLTCVPRKEGTQIEEIVGKVVYVDVQENKVGWGSLTRGRIVQLQGTKMWMPFKYKKLQQFSFTCGLIVHGEVEWVLLESILDQHK